MLRSPLVRILRDYGVALYAARARARARLRAAYVAFGEVLRSLLGSSAPAPAVARRLLQATLAWAARPLNALATLLAGVMLRVPTASSGQRPAARCSYAATPASSSQPNAAEQPELAAEQAADAATESDSEFSSGSDGPPAGEGQARAATAMRCSEEECKSSDLSAQGEGGLCSADSTPAGAAQPRGNRSASQQLCVLSALASAGLGAGPEQGGAEQARLEEVLLLLASLLPGPTSPRPWLRAAAQQPSGKAARPGCGLALPAAGLPATLARAAIARAHALLPCVGALTHGALKPALLCAHLSAHALSVCRLAVRGTWRATQRGVRRRGRALRRCVQTLSRLCMAAAACALLVV